MTQFPDFSTCLGTPPALSVVAAEASSPVFNSKDQNTSVVDVADVYTSSSEAKSDFPPLNSPKFASCFVQVAGSVVTAMEQSVWPSGTTFGTLTASVSRQPRYGDQSGLVEVEVPVNLPAGQGSTNDFFDILVIRQGRSTAELQIDQGDTTPPAELTESLAKAVTAKMKAQPPRGNTGVTAVVLIGPSLVRFRPQVATIRAMHTSGRRGREAPLSNPRRLRRAVESMATSLSAADSVPSPDHRR